MKTLENMRTTTISMIVGILIGMVITNISDRVSVPVASDTTIPPVGTKVKVSGTHVDQQLAPGLQIVEVPPPLNLNGLHPYQCYLNGQPVTIPKDVIKGLLANHTDTSEKDPNFNVHNFTGNLKMIDRPVGSTVPTSPFPVTGRVR
jgi:hypothetical protein